MGVGRFFCVLVPFALTIASIVFFLVPTLAGVANKDLYLFQVNVEDLSINPADVDHIVGNLDIDIKPRADKIETNITAKLLDLEKVYDISLWGYCYTPYKGKRQCVKPKFDWASEVLNTTYIEHFGSAAGVEIKLPDEVKSALKAYRTANKWVEVAFVAALVLLALEVILGIFANCSRIFSCLTWIIAGLAAVVAFGAALASTLMAGAVIGVVKGTAKFYGVKGHINNTFLAMAWIAVAFAIGASLFWLFTICCCKPEHRSRKDRKNRHSDGEKLLGGGSRGYAPLGNDHEMTTGFYNNNNQTQSQYGAPRDPSGAARSDLAYEPYSHRA
ncbi:Hypothetical protein NCS54_00144200 [Fusarium falciforme]|uniref:Hypothetical protein n=1 Tax=Fusarium falciforme TaxID=195108 RepID=UPI0023014E36|nr:Hypothetical protein NCS54_00144200 [Fusarium falciforme]WAO84234.1 Hypothetical protein NCS54_00144200 [Fusarium falciforme]